MIIVEGVQGTIQQTRLLIEEIHALNVDNKNIHVILNNCQHSEAQMAWTSVQERLGHPIAARLTPAPELFMQASHMQTPAVIYHNRPI